MTSSDSPSENNPTSNSQQGDHVQSRNGDPQIVPTTPPSQFPPSTAQLKATGETGKDWWDRHKRWVEILGVLLLAVYTRYTIKMYYANRDAATAATTAAVTAHDALILVQRPWLGVEGSVLHSDNPDSSVTDFSVIVKNFGLVPALHVGLRIDRIQRNDFEEKIASICDEAKRKTDNGRYIFPGSTYSYAFTERFVNVDIGGQPNPNIVHVGCVAYFGQFHDFHHTEFCFMKGGSGDLPLRPCPVKQEAD
jgi:hypothetical protein